MQGCNITEYTQCPQLWPELGLLRNGVRKRSELPAQSPIWLYKVVKTGFHCLKQHGQWEEKELSNPVFLEDVVSVGTI
jgi:hypothetical protein